MAGDLHEEAERADKHLSPFFVQKASIHIFRASGIIHVL